MSMTRLVTLLLVPFLANSLGMADSNNSDRTPLPYPQLRNNAGGYGPLQVRRLCHYASFIRLRLAEKNNLNNLGIGGNTTDGIKINNGVVAGFLNTGVDFILLDNYLRSFGFCGTYTLESSGDKYFLVPSDHRFSNWSHPWRSAYH